MGYASLETFARGARGYLRERLGARLEQVLASGGSGLPLGEWTQLSCLCSQVGTSEVVDRASYIWFNRLCAWRFMDLHHYTKVGLVSAAAGVGKPDILNEIKSGEIDVRLVGEDAVEVIKDILDHPRQHPNGQWEIYRLVLDGALRLGQVLLPFLFRPEDDWANSLVPEDILAVDGLLTQISEAMTLPDCEAVEVIGWLYQYYISECKDAVYAKLQNSQKVEASEIPAATQLFTPEWIVRYLVDNSLGRLWLNGHPDSALRGRLQYYIEPKGQVGSELVITNPEDILICDPACGSGHMLAYAFDILWDIYEECGYSSSEIACNIIEKNLWGLEIDQRAGQLAAFALTMKARSRHYGCLENNSCPHICVFEDIVFAEGELEEYLLALEELAPALLPREYVPLLDEFAQAKQFGSLIRPSFAVSAQVIEAWQSWQMPPDWKYSKTHQLVIQALRQAHYLSQKYLVVVTNPPYMGHGNMTTSMAKWLGRNYPDTKTDLFAAFLVRCLELSASGGLLGFMSPMVWMFLSSYASLRQLLTQQATITSLVQLEYSGFADAAVPICVFTLENCCRPRLEGAYIRLTDFRGVAMQAPKTLEAICDPHCGWFYRAKSADFAKLPGSPIAYWATDEVCRVFTNNPPLSSVAEAVTGLGTGDNQRFLRQWYEVSFDKIGFGMSGRAEAQASGLKWFPCNKGGAFRKWYGNLDYVVDWENDGKAIRTFRDKQGNLRSRPQNMRHYFETALSWSYITSALSSFRFYETGFINNNASPAVFGLGEAMPKYACYFNSTYVQNVIKVINPTLHFDVGYMRSLPNPVAFIDRIDPAIGERLIAIAREDWDSQETSWNFTTSPFLLPQYRHVSMWEAYGKMRAHWRDITLEMQELETSSNQLFLDTYGLAEQMSALVPLEEITLICNPCFRYRGDYSNEQLEDMLRADVCRDFVSFVVGCIFGRYALDKPGLILASSVQTLSDYNRIVYGKSQAPEGIFAPSPDNIVSVLSEMWFPDDVAHRIEVFIEKVFGRSELGRNLGFVEGGLGKDLRTYMLKDFYRDHLRRYRKRPIYWMFSSPKGAFNAMVYIHRCNSDTLRLLILDHIGNYLAKTYNQLTVNERVLEDCRLDPEVVSQVKKRISFLDKITKETNDYRQVLYDIVYPENEEDDVLHLDLDDGVKVNYAKLRPAVVGI